MDEVSFNVQDSIEENVKYTEIKDPYGYIYITTNLVNGKKYLGQKKFDRRWKEYIGSGRVFKEAVDKYGKKNFIKNIVYICNSAEELNLIEYELSVFFNVVESPNWYNLVYGGGTTVGMIVSNETRTKLSDSLKKTNIEHPEFGKYHSKKMIEFYKNHPEAKEKISNRLNQLWKDPNYVMHQSNLLKELWNDSERRKQRSLMMKKIWEDQNVRDDRLSGLKKWATNPDNHEVRSEISKQNWEKHGYREAQINRNLGSGNPMYGVHRYGINSPNFLPVYCIEMNKIYWGATQAENELHIKGSDIARCCKKLPGHKSAGKHPVTKEKLHWLYAEDAIKQEYITQKDLDNYLNNLKEKGD